MTKHIARIGTGALLGILVALSMLSATLTIVSAEEVVTENTPALCSEEDALNAGQEGPCAYEQEDTPFCFDIAATNYEEEGICEYSEVTTSCDDVLATNHGSEEECVYETPEEEPTDETPEEDNSDTQDRCEFEGHKYDETGTPLRDWVVGLMKFVTYEVDETHDSFILDEEATDSLGYYCLETNGYDGTYGIEGSYSFIYKIYEILEEGWENVSVEMGTLADVENNTLTVVLDDDIEVSETDFANDGDRGVQKIITVEVSEENGYIFADAAFHVDFYNTQTDDGDGEPDVDTYKVTGYVWNDKNENDSQDSTEELSEESLADWTVTAVSGDSSFTDVTDANGIYELDLPVGTWTICIDLKSEWARTFPNDAGACHIVTVPVVVNATEESTVIGMLVNLLATPAYAATRETYTGYNFGVVFKGCVANCGTSNGGGSSNGSRKSSKSSSKSVSDVPVPQVLGEATSVLPQGAPNTGAGGTAGTMTLSISALLAILMSIATLRAVRHETY